MYVFAPCTLKEPRRGVSLRMRCSRPLVALKRLTDLLALVADYVDTRNLMPMLERATELANERFDAGFDISEVQVAFHVLEEAIWSRMVAALPPDELVEAIGLISMNQSTISSAGGTSSSCTSVPTNAAD